MRKILVALLFVPSMAVAEFETGNKIYQHMTSSSTAERMYAMGYVAGVFDAYQHIYICPPSNAVTLGQVYDIVKGHLEQNPATRHRTADVLIKEVLQRVWPCSNRNQGKGV